MSEAGEAPPRNAARWPDVLSTALRALPGAAHPWLTGVTTSAVRPFLRRRRQVALAHLELAFPDLAAGEREKIWCDSLRHQVHNVVELARLAGHGRERAELIERVEITGTEHADGARALAPDGRGVVVVTAHVGNWELCLAAMAAAGHPMTVVHHGLGRPGLSTWLGELRTRQGDVELVELGRVRAGELLAAVRAGRHLVAMMDQNARLDEGAFAPFFGAPACTRRGPVVLAHRLGVPLLPAFSHRIGAGPAHRVEFGAPILLDRYGHAAEASAGASSGLDAVVDAALARVNTAIEDAIRAHPEQWIWSHRRFKTRPPGDSAIDGASPPIYTDRRQTAEAASSAD